MTRLRASVTLKRRPHEWEVTDLLTGITLVLEGEPPLDGDASSPQWTQLRALGLVEEALTEAEIRRRQAQVRTEALEAERLTRWKELLAFAAERVVYYRAREAFDPRRLGSLKDIERLPLMRKGDLRSNFPDGLVAEGVDVRAGLAAGALELAGTSGTTGERLQVISDLEMGSVPECYDELWSLEESDQTPRTAVFTSPTCLGTECHLGQMTYEERLRSESTLFLNSSADLFSMPKRAIENVVAELHRFRPDFLLVNPVYLHWLGRRCAELGLELPPVKLVLSCYQLLSGLQRRRIGELFGAPVYDYYGSTDLAGARTAVECASGRMHVRADHVDVEVLTASGAGRAGDVGALAVTTLANRVMPLVRYLVGDVGRLTGEVCDCPVADWPCLELHGRTRDLLRLDGRWVTPREIDEVVSRTQGVDFYSCLQTGDSELVLSVVPSPGGAPKLDALAMELGDIFKVSQVRTKAVARLDPEPSLKFRLTGAVHLQPPEIP